MKYYNCTKQSPSVRSWRGGGCRVVTRLLRTNQCPPLIVSLHHHQPPPVVTSFWWLVLVLTIQTRRMCAIHAVPVPGAGVLEGGGHNAQCARVSPAHGRCIVTILCLYAARALLGWAGLGAGSFQPSCFNFSPTYHFSHRLWPGRGQVSIRGSRGPQPGWRWNGAGDINNKQQHNHVVAGIANSCNS